MLLFLSTFQIEVFEEDPVATKDMVMLQMWDYYATNSCFHINRVLKNIVPDIFLQGEAAGKEWKPNTTSSGTNHKYSYRKSPVVEEI